MSSAEQLAAPKIGPNSCNTAEMARCLIIDDASDSAEGYAEYLRAFGFDVTTLGDSRQALSLISTETPSVVLLDLQMPHMDGYELLRAIRSLHGPALPVIVVSARVFPQDRRQAVDAGCDAFLAKPSAPDEVLATIRRLLDHGVHDGSC